MVDIGHYFSLRNERTFLFVFLADVGLAYAGIRFYPEYQNYILAVAFGVIIAFMGAMELGPHIYGKSHPHIKLKVWKKGDPPRDWDSDVYVKEVPEEAERVVDIFALMESNLEALRVLRYMGGRFWFPYLVPIMTGPEFPDPNIPHPDDEGMYENVELVGLVLPHPYTKFMSFTKRENGAYITGTEYTHPASVSLETIIVPFKLDFIGKDIPILIGVSSSLTIQKMTGDWTPAMNELARHVADFDKLIEENKIEIFPKAKLDDTLVKALPENQHADAKKKLAQLTVKVKK